jgi:hypothetical protein
MKIFKSILILFILITSSSHAAEDEIVSLAKDTPALKVAMAKILKGTKYKLYFVEQDSHVVMDYKDNSFKIHIAKSDYEASGTIEGALALTCHEMGHAAKGTKHIPTNPMSGGVSSEEDADYWAGKTCLSQMLKAFPKRLSSKTTPFDSEFTKRCEKQFSNQEKDLCVRGLRGGYFFRNNKNFQICNSQDLFFKSDNDFSKIPILGKRSPHGLQCSYNNLAAGVLQEKQPACINLVMSYFSNFNSQCEINDWSKNEIGPVEDDQLLMKNVVDTNRTKTKEINDSPSIPNQKSTAISE